MLDFQTAKNLIMSKEKILLLTHQKIDVDGLASILAFGTFLENLGKEVKIISTNEIPDSFEFLPFTKKVQISKSATKDFVISLKLNGASIEKLKYNTEGDKLNIVISPKNGEISQEGISFAKGIGKFDLIICADTASLENLGDLYFENTNLFFETPIINIDHHVTNGGFGQINLVDITSASATMIIFDLIKTFSENWKEIIDEDLATLLMAGLITDTGSFQYNNTSPKALEYAADLMDLGARQQEIIKNIYKTKQLSMLKIWGKILTNIKEDPISRVVWSEVDKNDFIETGATINEADGLIDELMTNAPGSEVIILAKEGTDDKIYVSLRSNAIAVDMAEIAKEYGGGGHKMAAGFVISEYQNFDAEIGKFIEKIQIMQKNRLGISEEDVKKIEENKPKKPVETKKDFSAVNVKLDLPEIKKEEKITEKPKSEEKNISETKEKPVEKKSEPEKQVEKISTIEKKSEKISEPEKKPEPKPEIKKEEDKKPEQKKQTPKNKQNQTHKVEPLKTNPQKTKKPEIQKPQQKIQQKPQDKPVQQVIKTEKVQNKPAQQTEAKKPQTEQITPVQNTKPQQDTQQPQTTQVKETPKPTQNQAQSPQNTQTANTTQADSVISPQEADKHARGFYDLLQKTPTDHPSYKKYYDSYMYYGKLAGWPGM